MGVNADGVIPSRVSRNKEIVVGFTPEKVSAPFFLRFGAALLDYVLVIFFPTVFLLLGRISGDDGARLLNSQWNTAGWLIAVLFAITNSIVLPVFSGQSIGKIATGIRIVTLSGTQASHRKLLIRQTLGYLLTLVTLGLGYLFVVLSAKGRSLHDLVAGTMVIHARRTVRDR